MHTADVVRQFQSGSTVLDGHIKDVIPLLAFVVDLLASLWLVRTGDLADLLPAAAHAIPLEKKIDEFDIYGIKQEVCRPSTP